METQPRRYRSLVTPALLILLGIIFLLNNFGLLGNNVWSVLWKLWPLWLVLVGLDMVIGRRTAWGSWVVAAVLVLGLGSGVTWAINNPVVMSAGDTVTVNEPLGDAKRAQVEIHVGVTQLNVHASSDPALLAQGEIHSLLGQNITQEAHRAGDTAFFSVKSNGVSISGPNSMRADWDLGLSTQVPIDLQIHTGVGQTNLDLSSLLLSGFELNTGIGETTLTLPGKGNFQATIHSGVGAMNVRLPAGLAARITVHQGIGAVNVHGEALRDGKTYTTPGYAQAADRVDLSINGGVGAVDVRFGN